MAITAAGIFRHLIDKKSSYIVLRSANSDRFILLDTEVDILLAISMAAKLSVAALIAGGHIHAISSQLCLRGLFAFLSRCRQRRVLLYLCHTNVSERQIEGITGTLLFSLELPPCEEGVQPCESCRAESYH